MSSSTSNADRVILELIGRVCALEGKVEFVTRLDTDKLESMIDAFDAPVAEKPKPGPLSPIVGPSLPEQAISPFVMSHIKSVLMLSSRHAPSRPDLNKMQTIEHSKGYFVLVSELVCWCPAWAESLLSLAQDIGVQYINLSSDGGLIDGLPTWD